MVLFRIVAVYILAALLRFAAITFSLVQHAEGWITEPDTTALIDHDVIRAVQTPALVPVDHCAPLTIRLLSHYCAFAMGCGDDSAFGIQSMPF